MNLRLRRKQYADDLARQVARADFFQRLARIVALTALLAIIVLLISLLFSIRDTQLQGTPTGKAILRSADRIESCTTPGGECYEQYRVATQGAIDSINEITIYAVTCSQQNPAASVDEVQRCVKRLYAVNHKR